MVHSRRFLIRMGLFLGAVLLAVAALSAVCSTPFANNILSTA